MVNDDLEQRRSTRLREYAIAQALARLETEKPGFSPEAIVASICAYEEEGNIAHVLEKMPESVNGEPYTTLVVVDGGDDRTAEIARSFPGVIVIEFPVNLGHGVALQVTYRYCVHHNVKYVVTLDADGQNDPSEIPQILAPLLADTTDFVLGSRVLGVDKTSDKVRKSRCSLLLLHHEPDDRVAHHGHVDRLPRPSRHDAGRRRRPATTTAVPNVGVVDHVSEARLAGQRSPDRVVSARVG